MKNSNSPADSFDVAEKRAEELKGRIEKLNEKYHRDDVSLVSDAKYDKLFAELQSLEEQYPQLISTDSPTQKVGSDSQAESVKVQHKESMLSLSNAFSLTDILAFRKRIHKLIVGAEDGHEVPIDEIDYILEPKIDGVALSVTYERGEFVLAATRGDGAVGEDVTANVSAVQSIPKKLKPSASHPIPQVIELRFEVYLSHQRFQQINEEMIEKELPRFKNARNLAASSLRQLDPGVTESRGLDYFCHSVGYIQGPSFSDHETFFEAVKEWGLCTNPHSEVVKNWHQFWRQIGIIQNLRGSLEYEIDGVVCKVNDYQLRETLGFVARAPRWAIAYKYPPPEVTTTLESVDFQVGRSGVLTPVARLKGVDVGGVEVQNATLHNMDHINKLNLHIGDEVLLHRAGDVIPQILRVTKSNDGPKVAPPEHCPCKEKAEVKAQGLEYHCGLGTACIPQRLAQLKHFVAKGAFNIAGLAIQTLEEFLERKFISTPADIFDLRQHKSNIENLKGFKSKGLNKLLDAIDNSRVVTLPKFIYALGIEMVGEVTASELAHRFGSVKALRSSDFETLANCQVNANVRVGEVRAQHILDWFAKEENSQLVDELIQKVDIQTLENKVNDSAPLNGLRVLFTGKFTFDDTFTAQYGSGRKGMTERIRELGANTASAVSKNVDMVFCGEDPGSKQKKAADLGIPILGREDWDQLHANPLQWSAKWRSENLQDND